MKCKLCEKELQICKVKHAVQDNKPVCIQQLCCINSKCGNYAGKDLNNPQVIAETITHILE